MPNPVKQIVDSAGNVLSIVDYEARNIIAPAYNTTKTYTVGEYCMYDNKMYKCTTSVSTPGSFDPNSWSETTNSDELSELNSSKVKWKDMTFSVTVSSTQYYGYYYYDIPINNLQLPTGSALLNVFIINVGANYPCICQIVNSSHIRVNSVTSAVNNVNVTFRISYI